MKKRLRTYKFLQLMLCLCWFIFTIIKEGAFNGWIVLSVMNECEAKHFIKSGLGFARFFTVMENLIYFLAIGLGIYAIVRIHRDFNIYEHPFEEIEMREEASKPAHDDEQ